MIKRPAQLILASLALIGLLGAIGLWWTGLHMGEGHNCISSLIQGTECPSALTSESMVYHLNTLKSFSSSFLQVWQLFSLLLAALLLVMLGLLGSELSLSPVTFHRSDGGDLFPPDKHRRWLSFSERSPSPI